MNARNRIWRKSMAGTAGLLVAAAAFVAAQDTNSTAAAGAQQGVQAQPAGNYDHTPLYRVQVVGRDIPAINYFQRTKKTKIGFEGTALLPQMKGDATIRPLGGRIEIQASFAHLPPANSLGPEYMTYVLWAITPEGRAVNLGEVLPDKKNQNQLTVTTDLQAFGLVLTAEPYYAVTVPSNMVVAQNEVLHKTEGQVEAVNVHYSLLPRGAYAVTAGRHEVLHPVRTNLRSPLELYEADNAIEIAEAGGADQYAPGAIAQAKAALQKANDYNQHKHRKRTITYAREAVQSAQDARLITIRKLKQADEQAAQQKQLKAQEMAREARQSAEEQAYARQQAERAAAQAQQQAQAAQQQQQQAEQAAAQARQEQQQAEAQTAAARRAQQQAEQSAQQLAQQAQQARERLRQQLSQVLQTRETARGLIMNMSDVLFGFDKYNLKPDAKQKLAKISGILLAYPDLKVQVEGYTDNIGAPQYNQTLSEKRADTVRNFLVTQDVPSQNVTAQGYGESHPVADNDTATGRAQNRRVELVVSGAAIGIQPSAPGEQGAAAGPATQPGTPSTARQTQPVNQTEPVNQAGAPTPQ